MYAEEKIEIIKLQLNEEQFLLVTCFFLNYSLSPYISITIFSFKVFLLFAKGLAQLALNYTIWINLNMCFVILYYVYYVRIYSYSTE